MYVSALLSSLHIAGVVLAFIGIRGRIAALRQTRDGHGELLPALFHADNTWGISAIVLLATGLTRAFAHYDKGSAFYLNNNAFYLKLGLFILVFILEIVPMVTLIRWRIATRQGRGIALAELAARSRFMLAVSLVQAFALVALLLVAPVMARGLWMRG